MPRFSLPTPGFSRQGSGPSLRYAILDADAPTAPQPPPSPPPQQNALSSAPPIDPLTSPGVGLSPTVATTSSMTTHGHIPESVTLCRRSLKRTLGLQILCIMGVGLPWLILKWFAVLRTKLSYRALSAEDTLLATKPSRRIEFAGDEAGGKSAAKSSSIWTKFKAIIRTAAKREYLAEVGVLTVNAADVKALTPKTASYDPNEDSDNDEDSTDGLVDLTGATTTVKIDCRDISTRVPAVDFRCKRYIQLQHSTPFVDSEAVNCNAPTFGDKTTVESRQALFGPCQARVPHQALWRLIVDEALHPLYIFQLGALAAWTADEYYAYAVVIGLLSICSLAIEIRSLRKVRRSQQNKAEFSCDVSVYRDGNWSRMSSVTLVPGDVFEVEVNCRLPCDCVLISGGATADESLLTGEAIPTPKEPLSVEAILNMAGAFKLDEYKAHVLYSGTVVVNLSARPDHDPSSAANDGDIPLSSSAAELTKIAAGKTVAYVLYTGFGTTHGKVMRGLVHPTKSPGINFRKETYKILAVSVTVAFLAGLVFTLGKVRRGSTNNLLLKYFDLYTIAVPPTLPTVMAMASLNAVRRLWRLYNISCLKPSVIVTAGHLEDYVFDKTGTLTEDNVSILSVVQTRLPERSVVHQENQSPHMSCPKSPEPQSGNGSEPLKFPLISKPAALSTVTTSSTTEGETAIDETTIAESTNTNRSTFKVPLRRREVLDRIVIDALATCHSVFLSDDGLYQGDPIDLQILEFSGFRILKEDEESVTIDADSLAIEAGSLPRLGNVRLQKQQPECDESGYEKSEQIAPAITKPDVCLAAGDEERMIPPNFGTSTERKSEGDGMSYQNGSDRIFRYDSLTLEKRTPGAVLSGRGLDHNRLEQSCLSCESSVTTSASSAANTDTRQQVVCPGPDAGKLVLSPMTTMIPVPPLLTVENDAGRILLLRRRFAFASKRQRMSVIVEEPISHKLFVFCKGSPEKVCSLCLPETIPNDCREETDRWTFRQCRILALAYRTLELPTGTSIKSLKAEDCEKDMQFLGLIMFANHVREDTGSAISLLQKAGKQCFISTGDSVLTAAVAATYAKIIPSDLEVLVRIEVENDRLVFTKQPFPCLKNHSSNCGGEMSSSNRLKVPSVFKCGGHTKKESEEAKAGSDKAQKDGDDKVEDSSSSDIKVKQSAMPTSLQEALEGTYLNKVCLACSGDALQKILNDDSRGIQGNITFIKDQLPLPQSSFSPHDGLNIMSHSNSSTPSSICRTVVIPSSSSSPLPSVTLSLKEFVVAACHVYGRMSPAQKALQVTARQKLKGGRLVLMCGDGANDCDALQASDVSVSLSGNEASVAASFTAEKKSIHAAIAVTLIGSGALVIAVRTMEIIILCAFVQLIGTVSLYTFGGNQTDNQYLTIDLMVLLLLVLMDDSEARKTLSSKMPVKSLLACSVITSIIGLAVIQVLFALTAIQLLVHAVWYVPFEPKDDEGLEGAENTVVCLVTVFQYIVVCFIHAENQKPWIRGIHHNVKLLLTALFLLFLGTFLVLRIRFPPFEIIGMSWDNIAWVLSIVELPQDFCNVLMLLIAINCLVSLAWVKLFARWVRNLEETHEGQSLGVLKQLCEGTNWRVNRSENSSEKIVETSGSGGPNRGVSTRSGFDGSKRRLPEVLMGPWEWLRGRKGANGVL